MGNYYFDSEIWKMAASSIIGIMFALAAISGNKYLEQSEAINSKDSSLVAFGVFMVAGLLVSIILGIRKHPRASISIVP